MIKMTSPPSLSSSCRSSLLQPPKVLKLTAEDDDDDDCMSSMSMSTSMSSVSDSDSGDNSCHATDGIGNSSNINRRSVRFDPKCALHVLDDNVCDQEDGADTWYSAEDIQKFQADAWMNVNLLVTGKNKNNKSDHCREQQFCSRGVECRTPLGRVVKEMRRSESMRAVLFYQEVQRGQQRVLMETSSSSSSVFTISNEQLQIEQDENANAIARIYASHCKDAAEAALVLGRRDEQEAVGSVAVSPSSSSPEEETKSTAADATTTISETQVNTVSSLLDDDEDDDDDCSSGQSDDGSDDWSTNALSSGVSPLNADANAAAASSESAAAEIEPVRSANNAADTYYCCLFY